MPAQVTVSLITPRIPRFVRIAGTIGYVRIDSLTERQLTDLAAAWKESLHEAAAFYRRRITPEVTSGTNNTP